MAIMSKHLKPMVFDHFCSSGIIWRCTTDGYAYIFYWNPIKNIKTMFSKCKDWSFGFLPFSKKHVVFPKQPKL